MSPKIILDVLTDVKMSRQYRYTKRKLLLGFCSYGGCKKPLETAFYCRYHQDDMNLKAKERRNGKEA